MDISICMYTHTFVNAQIFYLICIYIYILHNRTNSTYTLMTLMPKNERLNAYTYPTLHPYIPTTLHHDNPPLQLLLYPTNSTVPYTYKPTNPTYNTLMCNEN